MMAMGAVARPQARAAMAAADQWVADVAGQDDAMMDYFTAEEAPLADGVADGEHQAAADQSEIIEQLQARLLELEARAMPQQGGAAPVIDLEPRGRAPSRASLFDAKAITPAVEPGAMARLRQLAGPAPPRLSRAEALPDEVGAAAQRAFAEAEAGAGMEECK